MIRALTLPRPRSSILARVTLVAVVAVAGAVVGLTSFEIQIYVILLLVTVVAGVYLIPRAVEREPTVTEGLLWAALVVKILGSLARYVLLQLVFGGGDAVGYHLSGESNYELVRSLDFSFIQYPYFGTDFVDDLVPFLYAVTGPSMLGAFHVFSMLAFWGGWLFYRAHRIAFPNGDHRTYFVLLFFLPTMAFWPASLGKDALVVFGLGVAAHGLARMLHGISLTAFVEMLLGAAFTFGVRPAVGAMFLAAAAAAFLIHPGRLRSPLTRPLMLLFLGPAVLAGAVFGVGYALKVEKLGGGVQEVVEEYVATRERLLEEGGSSIEGPVPTSAGSFGEAVLTVLFRPFPWELTSPLAALAGVESLIIMGLVVLKLRSGWRGLRGRWRGGMVIAALIMSVLLVVPLTAVSNFGLLVRQRAQMLPFLFLLLTAAPRLAVRRSEPGQRAAAPSQAPALSG